MDYAALSQDAQSRHLTCVGGLHPTDGSDTLQGVETLILLGPHEPTFWAHFKTSPEWNDGQPDPMDRWSSRVIGGWAETLGAKAFFPFGGDPYHPFFTWATQTGRVHSSPIRLLVHDEAGLFASFRGALGLPYRVDLPPPPASPCDSCETRSCLTACPVGAFDGEGYDVPACKTHLGTPKGTATCLGGGCLARRACPVSARSGRVAEQSAYHMAQFLGI